MVKKQQKTAGPKTARSRPKQAASAASAASTSTDTPFAEQVKTSAQQIWSAGLAAFAKAQDQGGAAVGKAEATLDSAAHRMSDLAGEVGARAGQHWDKLESIFEDRVARALARLGMPAADEVAQLKARVEALSAEVALLRAAQAGGAPTAGPAAKHPAAQSTATRTASAASAGAAAASAKKRSSTKQPAVKQPAAKSSGTTSTSTPAKRATAPKAPKAPKGGKRTT